MTLPRELMVRSGALLVLFLVVLLPAKAAADVPEDLGAVGDTTDQVSQTVGDTTDQVSQTVGDTTDQVSQTVGDTTDQVSQTVGDTTDQVSQTVGDTTDQVSQTVGDTTDQVSQTVGDTTDQVSQTVGDTTDQVSSSSATLQDTAGHRTDREAAQQWLIPEMGRSHGEVSRIQTRSASDLPSDVLTAEETDEVGERADPCEDQPQLVCLGLLYGIGEFGNGGAIVMGLVATTGIAVIGLIVIAFGLGTSGSVLMVVSRRVTAVAEGSVAD